MIERNWYGKDEIFEILGDKNNEIKKITVLIYVYGVKKINSSCSLINLSFSVCLNLSKLFICFISCDRSLYCVTASQSALSCVSTTYIYIWSKFKPIFHQASDQNHNNDKIFDILLRALTSAPLLYVLYNIQLIHLKCRTASPCMFVK